MFADISHERQQSLLRQRNLFALTSAGLGIALVVAVSLAATRDREVVLLPTLPKQLTVSSAGVGDLEIQLIADYRGSALAGKVIRLANRGRKPLTLAEADLASSQTLAISIAQPTLKSGESTVAFIVGSNGGLGHD